MEAVLAVCAVQLTLAVAVLLPLGRRVRWPSRAEEKVLPAFAGLAACAAVGILAGVVGRDVWHLPALPIVAGGSLLVAVASLVVAFRPDWNAVGQLFFSSHVSAAIAYLAYAARSTFTVHRAPGVVAAAVALLALEILALVLSTSFAFETCDVLCRTRSSRPVPPLDPDHEPMVSLHIPAYNEPPAMLIETIRAAEGIDYPSFEIVVVDNNTRDPAVYGPVEAYCRQRERVRFVHVAPWPGYKSGALNLALREHTSPDAEILGVIDADYLVEPDYLRSTVGYFADPRLGFVQTPQDYREFDGNPYLTACYDAYRYFFSMAMPSRNERDSIIFAGTMGLLRRSALEGVGGWDEWCITEDAETSLRLLRSGWSGLFVARSFGRGMMPLEFSSLKKQRFRWCFGGMQILRRHWRTLMPWDRSPDNRLSLVQRLDYLLGCLQWLNDALSVGFSALLLVTTAFLLAGGHLMLRSLVGPALLLPVALLGSGLLRALWALRQNTPVSYRRALLAFANWLSLSWTVALACTQGLVRSTGVFLRTPKVGRRQRLWSALWATRSETAIAGVHFVALGLLVQHARAAPLVVVLVAWQGVVYVSSPLMSWLCQRSEAADRPSAPAAAPVPAPAAG